MRNALKVWRVVCREIYLCFSQKGQSQLLADTLQGPQSYFIVLHQSHIHHLLPSAVHVRAVRQCGNVRYVPGNAFCSVFDS